MLSRQRFRASGRPCVQTTTASSGVAVRVSDIEYLLEERRVGAGSGRPGEGRRALGGAPGEPGAGGVVGEALERAADAVDVGVAEERRASGDLGDRADGGRDHGLAGADRVE